MFSGFWLIFGNFKYPVDDLLEPWVHGCVPNPCSTTNFQGFFLLHFTLRKITFACIIKQSAGCFLTWSLALFSFRANVRWIYKQLHERASTRDRQETVKIFQVTQFDENRKWKEIEHKTKTRENLLIFWFRNCYRCVIILLVSNEMIE